MNDRDEYIIPQSCPMCQSENIVARVIFDKKIVRYVCCDCGHSQSIAKQSNLTKRQNTTLNHWAQRIIKHHPFCAICGCKEDLEAHHIIPVSNSRQYMYIDTNGITLCKKCHYLVHHKSEELN